MTTTRKLHPPSVPKWNEEDAAELQARVKRKDAAALVVFSRDWTVETLINQIESSNIDLDPAFQRRNAWRDDRRSRLIESFIMNFPVLQIVLAEHPKQKKKFIVIDGKQRLLTVAGFFLPQFREYWKEPKLRGLDVLRHLNKTTIDDVLHQQKHADELRQIMNADLRATVISNVKNPDILYDIFYRLNTGSVALSSQELRQVIHRGDFSRFIVDLTDEPNALWTILNITRPDARLRDVELMLRLVALQRFAADYKGNLGPFLDSCMDKLNATWTGAHTEIEHLIAETMKGLGTLQEVFEGNAGKKFKDGRYESQLNRAVFEVQALNLVSPHARKHAIKHKAALVASFEKLSSTDTNFLASIESTTKSVDNYRYRFGAYGAMFTKATTSPSFALGM